MRGIASVTDKDTGWAALRRTVESLKQGASYVKVGLLGDKAAAVEHEGASPAGEPLTNVLLMMFHEFGTAHLPERSVIRRVFDEHREENVAQLARLVRGVYEGRTTPKAVLEIMGHKIKWQMKNFVTEGNVTPPDAPETIERKRQKSYGGAAPGGPVTLIDTKHLVNAIDHLVVLQGVEPKRAGGEQVGSATLLAGEGS